MVYIPTPYTLLEHDTVMVSVTDSLIYIVISVSFHVINTNQWFCTHLKLDTN